ncbi:hypothetical protein AUR64_13595 [Haloprofundus marisrubri]|uniref:DUF5518 domain-containing protein n=1 Tax=Haloprofundus marisrubri TaxID=1514971 RepID=A0A0W1R620_9EURY|nr:DUF5518 domain-containing protein [Haloprofundus marisrubri]KTG08845.1 hypothetical protein AUR64_13595 [Haloprofundus marisrubri]
MTDWRAVGVGFVVLLVVGAVGLSVPILGQIGAGLIGGFAAGYLAGGGLGRGAWHGLVAGSISGIALTIFVALLGGLLGFAGGPLGGLVAGGGILVVGAVITLLFAIDSALAGAVGAWVKG